VSLRGIARLMRISLATVIRRIRQMGKAINNLIHYCPGDDYEIDELRTYVCKKSNPVWIAFALNRRTKQVVAFRIGRRTKRHLKNLVDTVLSTMPNTIYTDCLNIYKHIIPAKLHSVKRGGINHIERFHLSLRQKLKRLCRRSLAFSKRKSMLEVTVRIALNQI
jgi:IS1 family transposase